METQNINLESSGVRLAKLLLKNKEKIQKEALLEYQNNPAIRNAVENLKKRNAQRGTPVITAQ
jgi:hypothetical protein